MDVLFVNFGKTVLPFLFLPIDGVVLYKYKIQGNTWAVTREAPVYRCGSICLSVKALNKKFCQLYFKSLVRRRNLLEYEYSNSPTQFDEVASSFTKSC